MSVMNRKVTIQITIFILAVVLVGGLGFFTKEKPQLGKVSEPPGQNFQDKIAFSDDDEALRWIETLAIDQQKWNTYTDYKREFKISHPFRSVVRQGYRNDSSISFSIVWKTGSYERRDSISMDVEVFDTADINLLDVLSEELDLGDNTAGTEKVIKIISQKEINIGEFIGTERFLSGFEFCWTSVHIPTQSYIYRISFTETPEEWHQKTCYRSERPELFGKILKTFQLVKDPLKT